MESIKVTQSALIELIPYPRHKELKRQLYDDLLNYKDKQNHTTNVKAVMTEWNIISSEIQYLKDYIIGSLKKLPLRHDWGPGGDFEFKNFWANVYRHEDWTCTHNHTTEDLTMVYFLTEGEGDAPLMIDESKTLIQPKEGVFALFPGYINHGVPKHKSNNVRITLSADINRVRD